MLIAGAAAAQDVNYDSCGVNVRRDTVIDTIYAWIPPLIHGNSVTIHDFQAEQVRAVVASGVPLLIELAAPGQVESTSQPPADAPDLPAARLLIWFQVRNDGKLVGMRLERGSGWDLLDTAMQRAIVRADSAHALQPLPAELRGQAIDLWLVAGMGRLIGAASLPVARYRHLELHTDGSQLEPRLIGVAYRPQLPDSALRQGIAGKMLFDFVIDTTGFVDRSTIVMVTPEFRAYADEAMRAVRAAHFAPARIGRCKIRRHAQMTLGVFLQP